MLGDEAKEPKQSAEPLHVSKNKNLIQTRNRKNIRGKNQLPEQNH